MKSGLAIGGPGDKTVYSILHAHRLMVPYLVQAPLALVSDEPTPTTRFQVYKHAEVSTGDGSLYGFWVPEEVKNREVGNYIMKALVDAYRK